MPIIKFTVPGVSVAKGRPRFTRSGHCYTPGKTTSYEQAIAWAFKQVASPWKPLEGSVSLSFTARFPAPKTAGKIMARPKITRPDLDNILKCICDGLNGIAWVDDSQVSTFKGNKIESGLLPPQLEIEIEWSILPDADLMF
jgi:Holliday junction resolvase RusA-like endonuclease